MEILKNVILTIFELLSRPEVIFLNQKRTNLSALRNCFKNFHDHCSLSETCGWGCGGGGLGFMFIFWYHICHRLQCLQSSLAQDGGANHWQHCITDLQKALTTLIKSSQELAEIFEIVLRPICWAAGSEQPSPPLHRTAAARLLRCFDKYKSLYTRNMIASRFLVYNDLSKHFSSRAAAAR